MKQRNSPRYKSSWFQRDPARSTMTSPRSTYFDLMKSNTHINSPPRLFTQPSFLGIQSTCTQRYNKRIRREIVDVLSDLKNKINQAQGDQKGYSSTELEKNRSSKKKQPLFEQNRHRNKLCSNPYLQEQIGYLEQKAEELFGGELEINSPDRKRKIKLLRNVLIGQYQKYMDKKHHLKN